MEQNYTLTYGESKRKTPKESDKILQKNNLISRSATDIKINDD